MAGSATAYPRSTQDVPGGGGGGGINCPSLGWSEYGPRMAAG